MPPRAPPTGDSPGRSPPPRPSSLSLRAPRSASVQQLVSRWETQPDPSPSSSSTPSISALPPRSSSSSSLTAESSQMKPARSHRALLADPTNATNGTLGPLDWTPKYGIRADRASRPSPLSKAATKETKPSSNRSQKPHLIPLRSVQPAQTIPSPVSPFSDPSPSSPLELPPQSPSAFSPWNEHHTRAPESTFDTVASKTPLLQQSDASSSSTRTSRYADLVSPSYTQQSQPINDDSRRVRASTQASSSRTQSVAKSQNTFRSSARQPPSSIPPPQEETRQPSRTPQQQHHLEPESTREGLAKPSHAQHIFDLDAKVHLGEGKYLPSTFRRNIPDQAAPIPERSSSHLSGPTQKQAWSAEESSSIPLLATSPTAEANEFSSSTRVEAARWKELVSDELLQNAVCSNEDGDALPISADEVFKRDAPPIHLPALEEYLKNPIIFGEPIFTDSLLVCTEQEKRLFDLDDSLLEEEAAMQATSALGSSLNPSKLHTNSKHSRSSKFGELEVAGGQISCPAVLYASGLESQSNSRWESALRRRHKHGPFDKKAGSDEQPKQKRSKGNKEAKSEDADPLLTAKKSTGDDDDMDDDATAVNGKGGHELDSDDDATLRASDAADAEKVASRISARLSKSQQAGARAAAIGSGISEPPSDGVSSKLSTRANPITRKEMFPPLMLLKENSLDELKSNAIGPRKPPGGIWAVGWLGIIFDLVIGVEGSSFAAGILRLESLRDLFQIMTVQLHFQRYFNSSDPTTTTSKVFKFILQTLPAVLGFDLVSVFGYAVIFFVVWIVITALALWHFWRMTKAHNPNKNVEGYDSQGWIYKSASRGTRFANTCLVFVLGLLYLPLSKVAVGALVWSSDFWPVPNPYKGGIDDPDPGPLLGDPDIWRAPLEFCYTTTMRKDEFNWAYVIVPMAVLTILFYTFWYPYKLMMTIKEMLPHVSPYNELGRKRSEEEMQIYYHRLLNRDKSPFNFLYNSYHRKWGYYKPLYILLFKLTNLTIIGVLAKDNCLFRNYRTRTMLVVQQITLIVVMASLLFLHLWLQPFVDKIGNRSEMVSRIGYTLTATIGLLVALQVHGSTVYNTTILYMIQAFSYTGNIYFALVGMSFVAHQVKRWQSRVDYTIDIFSPMLDITKHIKRRVWEETLSILILCGPEYHMPLEQVIAFSVSDEEKWPPYLIDFQGSVAERHIENLKIVKQIGIEAYRTEVDISRSEEGMYRQQLIRTIQRDFAGPDAYWRPTEPPFPSGVMSFFGKAFVVPFPPTLVMRYDEGQHPHSVVLTSVADFEAYIEQNSALEVVGKKRVRQALRALEGQRVFCPYVQNVQVGDATSGMPFVDKLFGRISTQRRSVPRFGVLNSASGGAGKTDYVLATPISFVEGTLKIERRSEFDWAGYNFDSGFDVSIVCEEGKTKEASGALTTIRRQIEVSASRAFGLTEDFDLNHTLSRFLRDNESLIIERAPRVEKMLRKYRRDFERQARWKERVLPYSFLTDVFDNHGLSPLGLRMALEETGCGRSMRNLPVLYEGCVTLMYERLAAINRSPVHRFWWILFDEIWRLNSNDYSLLRKYRRSFSPQYPTSIAYRPMTRQALEQFLHKRGLWKKHGAVGGPFNRGLLNRVYFYLNELVFSGSHHRDRALNSGRGWSDNPFLDPVDSHLRRAATIKVGLGQTPLDATRRDISSIDNPSHLTTHSWGLTANPSLTPSQYTGGGTAYSTDSVIVRTAYRWEQRMDGYKTDTRWQRCRVRMLEWLSLHPVEVVWGRERLWLYLKLVDDGGKGGRYELLKPSCRPPHSKREREEGQGEWKGDM